MKWTGRITIMKIHFQDKLFNFYTFDKVIVRNQENSRGGPEAKKLDENGSKAHFFLF